MVSSRSFTSRAFPVSIPPLSTTSVRTTAIGAALTAFFFSSLVMALKDSSSSRACAFCFCTFCAFASALSARRFSASLALASRFDCSASSLL